MRKSLMAFVAALVSMMTIIPTATFAADNSSWVYNTPELIAKHCTEPVIAMSAPGVRATTMKINVRNDGSIAMTPKSHKGSARLVHRPICEGTLTAKNVVYPGDEIGRTVPENHNLNGDQVVIQRVF